MEFQTRSEVNGLASFNSLNEAMRKAEKDQSIWKISFSLETGERVRLVRYIPHDEDKPSGSWKLELMWSLK